VPNIVELVRGDELAPVAERITPVKSKGDFAQKRMAGGGDVRNRISGRNRPGSGRSVWYEGPVFSDIDERRIGPNGFV